MSDELRPSAFSVQDTEWMSRALQLARKGLYTTHPNPRVGCVLVKDGFKVAEGWHVRAGELHAEAHALREAGEAARGATAYVTLEPCAHTGRTPPCAEALVEAGVARVVAAMRDPFERVDGKGFNRLLAAGIKVEFDLLREQAEELNVGFLNRVRHGLPWVRLKLATSLDGRVSMASGESQWITGPEARSDVHHYRALSDVVLTGIGTVLADDPQLTVRGVEGLCRQPLRVVLDRDGRTPASAALFQTPGEVMIFRHRGEAVVGSTDVPTPLDHSGMLDLEFVFAELGRRGFNEVLAECGGTLAGSLLKEDLYDELLIYQAPCLLGQTAQPLARLDIESLADRRKLKLVDAERIGQDLRLRFRKTVPGSA